MAKGIATIDYQMCVACGSCIPACPSSFLELGKTGIDAYHNVYPQLVAGHKCTGCDLCRDACPVDCITVQA